MQAKNTSVKQSKDFRRHRQNVKPHNKTTNTISASTENI